MKSKICVGLMLCLAFCFQLIESQSIDCTSLANSFVTQTSLCTTNDPCINLSACQTALANMQSAILQCNVAQSNSFYALFVQVQSNLARCATPSPAIVLRAAVIPATSPSPAVVVVAIPAPSPSPAVVLVAIPAPSQSPAAVAAFIVPVRVVVPIPVPSASSSSSMLPTSSPTATPSASSAPSQVPPAIPLEIHVVPEAQRIITKTRTKTRTQVVRKTKVATITKTITKEITVVHSSSSAASLSCDGLSIATLSALVGCLTLAYFF